MDVVIHGRTFFAIFTLINLCEMPEKLLMSPFISKLNRITLSFKDANTEKDFLEEYQKGMLLNMKLAILFSILIYGLFAILDSILAPELLAVFLRVRFIYVLPLSWLVLIFFQFNMFIRYAQWLCSLLMITGGMGIIAMVALGGEELLQYYYTGLILVLIFNYDFLKLRFVYASFSGWIVVLAYGLVCFFSDISTKTLVMSGFFLVSANLFGMLSAYYFEFVVRRNYYTNTLLQIEQNKVNLANKSLEKKVEERSQSLIELNEHLKLAEEKYRTMIQQSNDLIWTTDLTDLIGFVNRQFEHRVGYQIDAFGSRKFSNLVVSNCKDEYQHIQDGLYNGLDRHYQVKIETAESRIMLLKVHGTPVLKNNEVTGIVNFAVDITESFRNEMIQDVIHRITEKANTMIGLDDILAFVHNEMSILYDEFAFLVGLYDKTSENWIIQYHSDELNNNSLVTMDNGVFSYIQRTKKSLMVGKQELQSMKDSGAIVDYSNDCNALLGSPLWVDDEVEGVIMLQHTVGARTFDRHDLQMLEVVSHHITQLIQRQKTNNELKVMLNKVTESDRLKSTFLATMSHELRTPLNAIIGFSDLIDEHLDREEILDYAKIISSSGNHLLKIVQNILSITLLEAGEVECNNGFFSFADILDELKSTILLEQQEKGKSHIQVNWDQLNGFRDFQLECDKKLLQQVFINLFKNAVKFTLEGSISLGCEVIKKEGKSFFQFFVQDTGIGIAKEKQDFIFDIFRQVDDTYTRRFGGIGVGLSVAAKLVKLMGGNIWLESVPDQGSTFFFTIPNLVVHTDKKVS